MSSPDRNQNPSIALIRKARQLGIEFDPFISTDELAKLVNSKRLTAPPTRTQLMLASELQLKDYDDSTTSAEMDDMIRQARLQRSKEALAAHRYIAEGTFLIYEGVLVEVRSISMTSYKVQLRRVLSEQGQYDSFRRYAYELVGAKIATREQLHKALLQIQARIGSESQPRQPHRRR